VSTIVLPPLFSALHTINTQYHVLLNTTYCVFVLKKDTIYSFLIQLLQFGIESELLAITRFER